jgi:hypothetical protein
LLGYRSFRHDEDSDAAQLTMASRLVVLIGRRVWERDLVQMIKRIFL